MASVALKVLFVLLYLVFDARAQDEENLPGPYRIFKTEPTFIPSAITVETDINRTLLEPGYFFIAPHLGRNGYGPQIVDHDGNLIWYGNPTLTQVQGQSVYGMDLFVCDYMGETGNHLCYSEGRPKGGEDQGIRQGGANRIFNNAYRPLDIFLATGNLTDPNPHEFNVVPGGQTLLQVVYSKEQMDLRPYAGKEDGWVYNGCFQELDIHSHRVVFQWCALDHMSVDESYLYLHTPQNTVNLSSNTGGQGLYRDPWDFMHLNSVDKNSEGDYLLSSRHMSSLIKVAGSQNVLGHKPGEIIWRLNGKLSNFTVEYEARFTRQHHARFISTTNNYTLISLFNNAYDGHTTASRHMSSAMIVGINNETMEAKMVGLYPSPIKKLSMAQGSVSFLPGGNVHVGWGSRASWSEFTENGTLLYHAYAHAEADSRLSNYRSFKVPWVGNPRTNPKLIPYTRSCGAFSFTKKGVPLHAYVSWNGATEVVAWQFYLSASSRKGPWIPANLTPRDDFETYAKLSSPKFDKISNFAPWVRVDAIDKFNQVIGRKISQTFVPSAEVREKCGPKSCYEPARFRYLKEFNQIDTCGSVAEYGIIALVIFILFIEGWAQVLRSLVTHQSGSTADLGGGRYYGVINI